MAWLRFMTLVSFGCFFWAAFKGDSDGQYVAVILGWVCIASREVIKEIRRGRTDAGDQPAEASATARPQRAAEGGRARGASPR